MIHRLAAFCAALGLLAFLGCTPKSNVSLDGAEAMKVFVPNKVLPVDASLELPGASIPVTVESRQEAAQFVVELTAFGETLEEERYESRPESFALAEALGEDYDPFVPLLGKGTSAEKPWQWKGKIASGGVVRSASASVSGKPAELALVGFKGPGRVVVMELSIVSGESILAERTLSFYFAEGHGLLKREFGQASTRIPAEPEGSSSGSNE